MAGARISGWRGAARRRRMVAARLLEVDGRIDGAGGFWIEQLPPARSASGSIYEKCRVDHSRKITPPRSVSARTRGSFRILNVPTLSLRSTAIFSIAGREISHRLAHSVRAGGSVPRKTR